MLKSAILSLSFTFSVFAMSSLGATISTGYQTTSVVVEPHDDAKTLADHLIPDVPLVTALLNAYEARYLGDWKKNDGDAVEIEYPGLYSASLTAAKNTYKTVLIESVPDLKSQFTQMAQDRLSKLEIEQLNSFFASEAGVRVMAVMLNGLPDGGTREQMEARIKNDLRNTASASETTTMLEFAETNAFKAMKQLRIDFRPSIAAWGAKVNKDAEPLITARIEAAVQTHISGQTGDQR